MDCLSAQHAASVYIHQVVRVYCLNTLAQNGFQQNGLKVDRASLVLFTMSQLKRDELICNKYKTIYKLPLRTLL